MALRRRCRTWRAHLSRLALNRGGPRDLGAILAGVRAGGEIAPPCHGALSVTDLAAELVQARAMLGAAPAEVAVRLAANGARR
jgi:DNA mismatch repair protein MutS